MVANFMNSGESPNSVVANVLDYNIIITKFKFQSCYYFHFQKDTPLFPQL